MAFQEFALAQASGFKLQTLGLIGSTWNFHAPAPGPEGGYSDAGELRTQRLITNHSGEVSRSSHFNARVS